MGALNKTMFKLLKKRLSAHINLLFAKNNNRVSTTGFTLVELIVAMSIFVVVISLTSGIFVNALRAQRRVNQLMTVNSDASLVLEKMAREARLGFNFNITDDSPGNCSGGTFNRMEFQRARNGSITNVVYRWNPSAGTIERSEGGVSFVSLNSPNVLVTRFCFLETQEQGIDPWRITFVLSETSRQDNVDYFFNLQSTISARLLPGEV